MNGAIGRKNGSVSRGVARKRAKATTTHPGPITRVCKRGRTPLNTSSICCSEL